METQIQAIMFGNDVTHFADAFIPFETYLVSTACVCESTRTYGEPLHHFYWTIDHNTIVEPIKEVIPPEQPLASPTQLKLASFDSFGYQPIGFEFGTYYTNHKYITFFNTHSNLLTIAYLLQDILAIVINASSPSYAANRSRIQEFIIIDQQ